MECCEHDWHIFEGGYGPYDYNCCSGSPSPEQKWYRQCGLCGRLESFTLTTDGRWLHQEEKWGSPI